MTARLPIAPVYIECLSRTTTGTTGGNLSREQAQFDLHQPPGPRCRCAHLSPASLGAMEPIQPEHLPLLVKSSGAWCTMPSFSSHINKVRMSRFTSCLSPLPFVTWISTWCTSCRSSARCYALPRPSPQARLTSATSSTKPGQPLRSAWPASPFNMPNFKSEPIAS